MTLIIITGIQAAGKSTVAQALAERFPHSVHVRGDAFRRMIVNGRLPMSANPHGDVEHQLHLRYRLAAAAANTYADEGFTTILQDTYLGAHLNVLLDNISHRPAHLIVLAPDASTVQGRDSHRRETRGKVACHPGRLEVNQLDSVLRSETPRLGYWLDSSRMSVEETVQNILDHLPEAAIDERGLK